MTVTTATCSGCREPRPTETLVAFRPDGMGDTFTLCRLCRRAVAASDVAGALERTSKMRVQLGACAESRLAIIEMMIAEMSACADAFESCCRGGYMCGCGSAGKSARAIIWRLREQRPNDGRSNRCGIRVSGDAWCTLDVGHDGEHI